MLTPDQRAAGIAHLEQEVQRATDAVNNAGFHFWETDEKNQQLGAIKIIANTSLPVMRRLAALDTDEADAKFEDQAHVAEQSLAEIRGYTADATFDSVIAATATQTAKDTGELAAKAADVAATVANKGLSVVWAAIPLPLKIIGGVAIAGVGYFYLRPLLPSRKAAA